ncbi:MAG: 3-keto-disaccharide hydrolase [Burkholderiales bacterium]
MQRQTGTIAALLLGLGILGCSQMPPLPFGLGGWTTLIDGEKGMDNFNRIGDANWRAEGGAIVADRGKGGHLVTKKSYKDFQLHAEFWAERNTNSGIFIRAQDPNKIGAENAFEVNIYDQRPGPEYSTAGIVNFAKVPVPPVYKAEGKWNTFDITAAGSQLTVVFNGTKTADIQERKFAQGPFSLQFGNHGKQPGGAIKWRKVQVRPL